MNGSPRVYGAVFAIAALVLAAMSIAAHNLAYFPADVAISQGLQAHHPSWSDTATDAVSWLGFPPQSNILLGTILVVLLVLGQRWAAVNVLVAAIGSGGLYFALQQVVGQSRPTEDLVHVAFPLPMGGFPSGHLATFTAVFGLLAFLGYRALHPSPARWLPVGLVVVLLAVMSFARIYAGQHWASGVLAGCLLGWLWLAATVQLYLWGEARFSRPVLPSERRYLSTASTCR